MESRVNRFTHTDIEKGRLNNNPLGKLVGEPYQKLNNGQRFRQESDLLGWDEVQEVGLSSRMEGEDFPDWVVDQLFPLDELKSMEPERRMSRLLHDLED